MSLDDTDRRPLGWVLAVTLAALSMLAHGGTIFALIALIPFALRRRTRIPLRALAASVVPAAACYIPWMLFQRFVDPPGNRLLKWQIAGVIVPDSRGFVKTLVMQYQALSFHHLLSNKWVNVESLVANPFVWHRLTPEAGLAGRVPRPRAAGGAQRPAAGGRAAAPRRGRARVQVLPARAGAGGAARGRVRDRDRRCGSSSCGAAYGITTINHQGAYAVIVLFIALCALAVTYLPRPAAALLLAGNAAWFAVCWVPGLGFTPAAGNETPSGMQFSPAMLLVCLAGLILAAAAIALLRFAPDPGPGRPASGRLDGLVVPEPSLPLPGGRPGRRDQNFTAVHDAPPSLVSSSLPGDPYGVVVPVDRPVHGDAVQRGGEPQVGESRAAVACLEDGAPPGAAVR